jgi:hypothetical protein
MKMKQKLKKNFGNFERTGSTLLEELRFQQKNKKKKKAHYNSVEIVEVDKTRFYRMLKESKD